jgi:hypothetical protein
LRAQRIGKDVASWHADELAYYDHLAVDGTQLAPLNQPLH